MSVPFGPDRRYVRGAIRAGLDYEAEDDSSAGGVTLTLGLQ